MLCSWTGWLTPLAAVNVTDELPLGESAFVTVPVTVIALVVVGLATEPVPLPPPADEKNAKAMPATARAVIAVTVSSRFFENLRNIPNSLACSLTLLERPAASGLLLPLRPVTPTAAACWAR